MFSVSRFKVEKVRFGIAIVVNICNSNFILSTIFVNMVPLNTPLITDNFYMTFIMYCNFKLLH